MEEDKEESFKKLRQDDPPATAASLFTDDLILKILSCLPFRSLCRSKCVSVPWRDLIADPAHRKMLRQTLAGFLYSTYDPPSVAWTHHFASVLGSAAPLDPSLTFLEPNKDEYIAHVDTCNGLLLCARLKKEISATGKDEVRYVVCNPATEKWIELPPQPQDWENRFHSVARLAFDPAVSSHFHIAEFIQSSPGYVTGVDIFSSQTGAWSRKDSVLVEEITLLNGTRSVFFGGMLHLVGKLNLGMQQECVLLVVDMEGKAWKTIHLPVGSSYETIELSQGCLYFAGTTLAHDNNSIEKNDVVATNITLWCLDNYDSKEWVLKRSASIYEPLGTPEVEWRVFAIHPDRDTVFLVPVGGDKLASYDMLHQKFVHIFNLEQYNHRIYLPYVPLFSEMQIGSSVTSKPPLCFL